MYFSNLFQQNDERPADFQLKTFSPPLRRFCSAEKSCGKFAKIDGVCLGHFRIAQLQKESSASSPQISTTERQRAICVFKACGKEIHPRMKYCEAHSKNRQCQHQLCGKYALRGGFCIRHGGGKTCGVDNCTTAAQSGGLCKLHGGGSRCKAEGCSRVARRRGFCVQHGGRNLCKNEGCSKTAHKGGCCIMHGGGRRCTVFECTKSAQSGGLCFAHGGGKRCSLSYCNKGARKTGYCTQHEPEICAKENVVSRLTVS